MSQKYTFKDFVEIINTLRSENGCPWDREQTHESLRPCLMEEAAELIAAIRIFGKTGNADNMKEELGDVLLQVVMHAQIAKEEGLFSMEDVVEEIAAKMVRRHPHVFGDVQADTSAEVLRNWDEIKTKEKETQSWIESPLKEIPPELPALTRAPKVLKKADKHYGIHSTYTEDVEVLEEGLKTLRKADISAEEMAGSLGDMLMAISDLARQHKLPLEQILNDKIEDYIESHEEVEKVE